MSPASPHPYRAKIYGAGSVGNHLTNAAHRLGWDIVVCDPSEAARRRMKEEIYPARYGGWDDEIDVIANEGAPRGDFDVIIIGTPPDSHLAIALDALEEAPRALLIEKPLCAPTLEGAQELFEAVRESPTRVFVGYNHLVGEATGVVEDLLRAGAIGELSAVDVEFREHWGGIFAAHPWLSGPADSYLGDWRRGGGASGEHSHAANLWQHLASVAGAGRVAEVSAMLDYTNEGAYDRTCFLQVRTENGLLGRIAQDVVTVPTRKLARMQGNTGELQWIANYDAAGDAVVVLREDSPPDVTHCPKNRADDFIRELEHVSTVLESGGAWSPLGLERGLDTMMVVAAAHLSQREGSLVNIDYEKGYMPGALDIVSHLYSYKAEGLVK